VSARDDVPVDGDFDLAALLWGARPKPLPAQDQAPAPDAITTRAPDHSPLFDNDHVVEGGPLPEPMPAIGGARGNAAAPPAIEEAEEEDRAEDTGDDEFDIAMFDEFEALAALNALGAIALDEDGADDDRVEPDPGGFLGERNVGIGELTDRLERVVLPRLRGYVEMPGYLSLGHLAWAIVQLQGSAVHLDRVRTFVEGAGVPVVPARSHMVARDQPIKAIREAQRRFGYLLHGAPDERLVLERLGYGDLRLTAGTRAFLMQAWAGHCLSRGEERQHAETVAAEIARVGEDWKQWAGPARVARDALILDNLWLVVRVARGFVGRGVEIDDLHQMGSVGLFRAVEKYDVTLGNRFITYASTWVYQSIHRGIADSSLLIRLPVHVQGHRKVVNETVESLWRTLGRAPTIEEVIKAGEVTSGVVRALLITSRLISLDDHRNWTDKSPRSWIQEEVAHRQAERDDLVYAVQSIMKCLQPREMEVLTLRFGFNGGQAHTLEDIARRPEFRVTRERIRQIEAKALRRLEHPSKRRLLRAFLDQEEDQAPPHVPLDHVEAVLPHFTASDQAILKALFAFQGRSMSIGQAAKSFGVPA